MRCTARSKQSGEQCKRHAVNGRNVCSIHGGKTPRGVASPHFKHGQYSRYAQVLPERLLAKFQTLLENQDDIEKLGENIALTELRIVELLDRLNQEDFGADWLKIRETYSMMIGYMKMRNFDKANDAMVTLGSHIDKGVADYQTWKQIHADIEAKRKLVETKQRIVAQEETSISLAEAMTLITQLVAVINSVVSDKETRQKLTDEFSRILPANRLM